MGQHEVAKIIKEEEPITLDELSEKCDKPKTSLSGILRRMRRTRNHYIERKMVNGKVHYVFVKMPEKRYTVEEIKEMRDD